jgi:hypothetical protein
MAQVLTSEGLAEFHATGKVAEFVKPEAEAKPAKVEAKEEPSPVITEPEAAKAELDDVKEDDEGLTAAERKAYSEKIARKISAKHRALKQAEAFGDHQSRERQAAEKKASDLAKEIAELKAKAPSAPQIDGGPKREDFDSDAAWWDAKIDWKADQKAELKVNELDRKRERAKRIEKFASTVDDYDDMLAVNASKKMHQPVIDYATDSDLGPALMYYYGQNPDEYDKLSKLSPVSAVAAMGKLEAKLERQTEAIKEAKGEPEPAKTSPLSRAPEPIQALSESATPLRKKPEDMDVDELRAYNRQQRIKQAR